MNVNLRGQDLTRYSAEELYALGISPEERAKRGIKTDLPYLTRAEIKELHDSMAFAYLLFIEGQVSVAKTDSDLSESAKELKKLNNWIDQINQGLNAIKQAKADNPDATSMEGRWPVNSDKTKDFKNAITDIARWANEKGLNISFKLETGVETEGPHKGQTWYEGKISNDIDTASGQLQSASTTLGNVVKDRTTEIQKLNAARNNKLEILSNLMKKLVDTFQGIMRGV